MSVETLSTFYARLDELDAFASDTTSVPQGWIQEASSSVPSALLDMACEASNFVGVSKSRHVEKTAALLIGAALLKKDKTAKQNVLTWIMAPCPTENSEADGVTPRVEPLHSVSKRR